METYDVSQARNQNAYWVEGADINSQFTSPNFEQSGVMNNEGSPEFVLVPRSLRIDIGGSCDMETYNVSQARNQNAYWVEGADINSQFTSPNFEQSGVMNNEGAPEFVDQSMYYPAATNYGYYCTGKRKMQLNKEQWLAAAILSSIAQVTLMSVLDYPYQKDTILLSFGQACFHLLPAILWNVLFVVTFVYAFVSIIQLTPSSAFRVPILGMLCLNFVYGLFKWLIKASRFNVLYYSLRINGALFMSLWVLGFLILDMIVLFLGGDFDEKVEEE